MGSFQIGRIFGIPIRAHITLLIVLPLIGFDYAQAMGDHSFFWGLITAVGLFASVVLHELGHSVVAMRKGCRPREILLLPIGGVAQMDRLPTRPADEFQVAIAGPAVSLLLAVIGWGAGSLLGQMGLVRPALALTLLGAVNFMLVLFNLLPSFPMDGGRIFRAWLTPRMGRLMATRIAAKVGRFMAIVFGVIGLFKLNIFLILIAFFIYQAAGSEYRMVRIQEASRNGTGPFGPWMKTEEPWSYADEEITVSPPPFRKGRTSHAFVRPLRAQHDLFDDLFEKWR
jgi:Zn-dependent protease